MTKDITYHSRSRDSIVMEVVIDINHIPRFRAIDPPGNRDKRARCPCSSTCHGDLRALDVELRNAGRVRVMDGELLDTQDVVTAWKGGGDVVCVCFYITYISIN